jgi:hypothetical protein
VVRFSRQKWKSLFSTTKETKGHKGKKAKKNPLCTFVTLRGKVFPPETDEPLFFNHQGDEGAQREKSRKKSFVYLCDPSW